MISVKNVSFSYNEKKQGLKNVNIKIDFSDPELAKMIMAYADIAKQLAGT